jgi:mono/diheme cytochrome c family protein
MTLRLPIGLAFLAAALAAPPAAPGPSQAASEEPSSAEAGDYLYKTYCASCHGKSAEGDGPLAPSLRLRPPDLTRFARRNAGKFDAEKVAKAIDGREDVKGHGSSDMPVWGDAFKRASEGYSEKRVRARVDALVGYLEGLQVK